MTDGLELGDVYGATVERIKAQDDGKSRLGVAALMWVSHAERPLRADELCHALAVDLGSKDFNAGNAPSISTLMSCCQGLIAVDKETLAARLIHPTVKEYLSTRLGIFGKPHAAMAEICLTYLNSEKVKALSADPSTAIHDNPFLEYCSVYWGIHAKRELSDQARSLALELLREYDGHISAKLLLKQVKYLDSKGSAGNFGSDIGNDIDFTFSGLDCVSFFGIAELVTTLKEMACYRDGMSALASTLAWATRNGQEEVVEMMFRCYMPDPNCRDHFGLTPLIYAIRCGHGRVMEILLRQTSVHPDWPDDCGRSPLSYAAQDGLEEVVEVLHRRGADPNNRDNSGDTPLSFAAGSGRAGVVKILLKCAISNVPNYHDQTPLLYAAAGGHEEVVKMLLGQGVWPDFPDDDGRTPLMCAASGGHEEVVKILLEQKDVNPDGPDNDGRTPLLYAASGGHEGVVKILLGQEKVNPNKPDYNS